MKGKVLIADDDEEIRDLLRFALEGEQFQVIETVDGAQALEKIMSERPDLVILDVMMPKMTGYEVCEKVRSEGSTCLIPIILLTSLAQTKDKVTGIKLGADEYLTKPFEPFELVMRAEGLLKRTREALSANPLTGLPGNISIENEIKRRLDDSETFSVIYLDANNFKAYNDKYGFERGDGVIRLIAAIVRDAVKTLGSEKDFIGHIGGEDFIILTQSERAEIVIIRVMENFASMIPNQYDDDVRQRG
ncbi:MAG: response regulator, partial [Elusimicrobia bacterium]|nr:response regulator [Elusimicrobiota bacterium]MBD3412361.1 response regulator [Elusimicrobiota bacterium]